MISILVLGPGSRNCERQADCCQPALDINRNDGAIKGKLQQFILFTGLVICLLISNLSAQENQDSLRLSLKEITERALANNEKLQASQALTKKSKYAIDEAAALQLPKVSALFSYNYLDIVPGFRSLLLGDIEHDIFPRIQVDQVLYAGGKISELKKSRAAGAESAEFFYDAQVNQVKFTLASIYFQLMSLKNQVAILERTKQQLGDQQRFTRLLSEAGKLSALEISRIEVEIADVGGRILKLQNDYQTASHAILQLMGKETPALIIPRDTLHTHLFNRDMDTFIEEGYAKNPLLKRFDSELKKQQALLAVQQAERLPQVSASAWYGYEFGPERFSFDQNDRYFVALNASLPLYTGSAITAKTQQARMDIESLQHERTDFQQQLKLKIETAYRKVLELNDQIDIQKQALNQVKDSYRLAILEYQAGSRSNSDLLDIQKKLLLTEISLNEFMVQYKIKEAELLYWAGIL